MRHRRRAREGFLRKMRQAMFLFPAIVVVSVLGIGMTAAPQEERPAKWAQPIVMDGVPNLYKVSDRLYRSAQPTAEGMKNLKEMGIKTVVNLRSFHSDSDEIGRTSLVYEHIHMKAWHPEEKEIVRFLQIVTTPGRTPVLVHCQHGADRTGTMCAVYRIVVQGWTKEEAIREMVQGGYGFHKVWGNLEAWINKLDVERVKEEAALGQDSMSPSPD
jgi:protein tyrosine phosphatase (PTP) superfamily phosphohydrolase (DUF442 family)